MKIAVEMGKWHGLHDYLLDYIGWTDDILSTQTGDSVISGTVDNIRAAGEDPFQYDSFDDGDNFESFEEGVLKFYEIHEFDSDDINRIINDLKEGKK